ncbi:hypothetical protein BC941DRAFT_328900, partial [Chlamydoabsidia padenii]
IPPSQHISENHQAQLISPISEEDILLHVNRSKKISCPGADGLGYQYLSLIYQHPKMRLIMNSIYNEALTLNRYP